MTRYQKELYKNYSVAAWSATVGTLSCALVVAFFGGGAYALITIFEMFVIVLFRLETELVVSEIAKWGIGSAAGVLVLLTALGLTIESFIQAKEEAREKIDTENKNILDALQGNFEEPKKPRRCGVHETI